MTQISSAVSPFCPDATGGQQIERLASLPQPMKQSIKFVVEDQSASPTQTPKGKNRVNAVSNFVATATLQETIPSQFKEQRGSKSGGRLLQGAATSSITQGLTLIPGVSRSNATNQNSQIHGRKVDSPKIYIKDDISEGRPKTSAQAPRKSNSQQQNSQITNNSKAKNQYNKRFGRAGFQSTQSNSLGNQQQISGQVSGRDGGSGETRKFDFNFATDTKSHDGTSKGLHHPVSATAKGAIQSSSGQTLQLEGPNGMGMQHPKTTSNAALASKQLLSGALSKYQQQRQTTQSFNAQNGGNASNAIQTQQNQIKTGKDSGKAQNLSSGQPSRKRHQSQGNVSTTFNNPASLANRKGQTGVTVGQSSSLVSGKEAQQSVSLKQQIQSPQVAGKTAKINGKLPPKHGNKNSSNQTTKDAKEKQTMTNKESSMQSTVVTNNILPAKRTKRTRSSDCNSKPSLAATQRGRGPRKPRLNQTILSPSVSGQTPSMNTARAASGGNHHKSQNSHSVGQGFNKGQAHPQTSTAGGGNNRTTKGNHFNFELDNQENTSQNLDEPFSDKAASITGRNKSASASRSRGRSNPTGKQRGEGLHGDISSSSLSGQSREKHATGTLCEGNVSGNFSKMLRKNYFVEGGQLLRNLSPGTPQRSDDVKNKISGAPNLVTTNSATATNRDQINSCTAPASGEQKKSQQHKSDKKQKKQRTSVGGHKGSTDNIMNISTTKGFTQIEAQHQNKKGPGNAKTYKQAQELLRMFMEQTHQRKCSNRDKTHTGGKQYVRPPRSYSCINKVDPASAHFFSPGKFKERDKSNEVQHSHVAGLLAGYDPTREWAQGQNKRPGQKEPSCVLELHKLKKEINDEIRREVREGKHPTALSPDVPNSANRIKRDSKNATTTRDSLHQQIDTTNPGLGKVTGVKNGGGYVINSSSTPNYISLRKTDPESRIEFGQNTGKKPNDKTVISNSNNLPREISNNKIRRFIEKQKKKLKAKMVLEETIELDKTLRIRQTLMELQNFARTGERQSKKSPLRQPGNRIYTDLLPKPTRVISGPKSSSQNHQSQLINHLRTSFPNNKTILTVPGKTQKRPNTTNTTRIKVNNSLMGDETQGALSNDVTIVKVDPTENQLDIRFHPQQDSNSEKSGSKKINSSQKLTRKEKKYLQSHDVTSEPLKVIPKRTNYQTKPLDPNISQTNNEVRGKNRPNDVQSQNFINNNHDSIPSDHPRTVDNQGSPFISIEPSKPSNDNNPNNQLRPNTISSNSQMSPPLLQPSEHNDSEPIHQTDYDGQPSKLLFHPSVEQNPRKHLVVDPNTQNDPNDQNDNSVPQSDTISENEYPSEPDTARQNHYDQIEQEFRRIRAVRIFQRMARVLVQKKLEKSHPHSHIMVQSSSQSIHKPEIPESFIPLQEDTKPLQGKFQNLTLTGESQGSKQKLINQTNNVVASTKKVIIPELQLGQISSSNDPKNKRNVESSPPGVNVNNINHLDVDHDINVNPPSSQRTSSIFNHNSFDHIKPHHLKPQGDGSIAEFLKVREKAIEDSRIHRQNLLAYEFKQQKFSPRTYASKKKDLEVWVTKEREDIRESKRAFEKEWEKTQKILESTKKDAQAVKQILGSARSSSYRPYSNGEHMMGNPRANSDRTSRNSIKLPDNQSKSHRNPGSYLNQFADQVHPDKLPNESSSQTAHQNDHYPEESSGPYSSRQSKSRTGSSQGQYQYGPEGMGDMSEKKPNSYNNDVGSMEINVNSNLQQPRGNRKSYDDANNLNRGQNPKTNHLGLQILNNNSQIAAGEHTLNKKKSHHQLPQDFQMPGQANLDDIQEDIDDDDFNKLSTEEQIRQKLVGSDDMDHSTQSPIIHSQQMNNDQQLHHQSSDLNHPQRPVQEDESEEIDMGEGTSDDNNNVARQHFAPDSDHDSNSIEGVNNNKQGAPTGAQANGRSMIRRTAAQTRLHDIDNNEEDPEDEYVDNEADHYDQEWTTDEFGNKVLRKDIQNESSQQNLNQAKSPGQFEPRITATEVLKRQIQTPDYFKMQLNNNGQNANKSDPESPSQLPEGGNKFKQGLQLNKTEQLDDTLKANTDINTTQHETNVTTDSKSNVTINQNLSQKISQENSVNKSNAAENKSINSSNSGHIRVETWDDMRQKGNLPDSGPYGSQPETFQSPVSQISMIRGSVSLESSRSDDLRQPGNGTVSSPQSNTADSQRNNQPPNIMSTTETLDNQPITSDLGKATYEPASGTKEQAKEDPAISAKADELTEVVLNMLMSELNAGFDTMLNRKSSSASNEVQEESQQQAAPQVQGIRTDLFAIERYVEEVLSEIKANEPEFMKSLNEPLETDHLAFLNKLQNSEIGSCEHFDENFPQILPLELYLTLEKRRKEARERAFEEENTAKDKTDKAAFGGQAEMLKMLLVECEHIHNKVLFDCINDSLLQFKPYGKDGEPHPWSRKNRRLKPTDDFTLHEIFEIVKHDLFRWAITQAGTLPRREFMIRGVFDEEWFAACREKRLLGLLDREMVETETKWLNYEFEQAQVKIDIGDMILEQIVSETLLIMNEASKRTFDDHPLLKEPEREQTSTPLDKDVEKDLSAGSSNELERDSGVDEQDEHEEEEALLKQRSKQSPVGQAAKEEQPLGGEKGAAAAQQKPGTQTDDEDEDYSKDSDFSNNNFSEEDI